MLQDKNTRQSNFEILRIIAMIMIIGCHLSGHGVMHMLSGDNAYIQWSNGKTINKFVASMLMPGAQIGTAIFFLISGYFGINLKPKSIFKLLCTTLFYGIVSILVFVVVSASGLNFVDVNRTGCISYIVKMIIVPLSGGAWWYVTAYTALLLISPLLNKMIEKLSNKGIVIVLVILWIFCYTIGVQIDAFYNLEKAVFFYILGSYIKKNICKHKDKVCTNLICIIVTWIIGSGIYYYTSNVYANGITSKQMGYFVKMLEMIQIAFVTPICSVSFIKLFSKCSIQSNKINKLATTTFGIFLLHDSGVVRGCLWNPVLDLDGQFLSSYFPIFVIADIFAVFTVGALIEMLRIRIMRKFEMNVGNKLELFCKTLEKDN